MKTIRDINVKNKNVLVRVDYNVPIKNGKITDDLRIRASLPTIKYLLENGASKIILISHLGRPDGQKNSELSLKPIVKILKKLLPDQKQIDFCQLPEKDTASSYDTTSKITLLENLRFDPGEEENSKEFIKNIIDATKAEIFVQDGFAVTHRAHASTDAIKDFLPIYAGILLDTEIKNLKKAIESPKKPLLLILGGSKIKDKTPLIDAFLDKADRIVVGGKIAADGFKSSNPKIYVAEDFDEDATGAKLDIGPFSTAKIAEEANNANTIIWNGLLGYAEDPAYATSYA